MILLQDLPPNAIKGQEKEVAVGYARNFLFPKQLAVYNTPENRKAVPLPSVSKINICL